ncbi:MAG: hypothetical protein H0X67_18205 [Acidobacteria bacterium]|nr:hypothetical protein [Acidobacteriota bacterium]
MEFIAGLGRCPLEVEAFPEPGKGPPFGSIEGLPLAHDRFEPICQERADRAPFLGGYDTRLAQKVGIKLERDVGFHDDTSLARQTRAAQPYVLVKQDSICGVCTQSTMTASRTPQSSTGSARLLALAETRPVFRARDVGAQDIHTGTLTRMARAGTLENRVMRPYQEMLVA